MPSWNKTVELERDASGNPGQRRERELGMSETKGSNVAFCFKPHKDARFIVLEQKLLTMSAVRFSLCPNQ